MGDQLDYVPKYQFTASAQRDFTLNAKPSFFRVDYNQQGPETYKIRSIGPWFYNESDVVRLLSLHTGLLWSDNLRLGTLRAKRSQRQWLR